MHMVEKETIKRWRKDFRKMVLERDNFACVICGWSEDIDRLDPHHIIDRNEIPNWGYVQENGITLCPTCHRTAEDGGYSEAELFKLVGSSKEKAFERARSLK